MRWETVIKFQLFVLLALGSGIAATPDRIRGAVNSRNSKVVAGHLTRQAQSATDQGTLEPGARVEDITLVVKLSSGQQTELDTLIRDQQNPSSPNYKKWLTPEEFGNRFGLSAADEAKLSGWLEAEGLQVTRSRARNSLRFSGTSDQVSRALHTSLHRFRSNGQSRFAATAEPSVPEAFEDIVAGFIGLNDFPLESTAKLVPPNFNSGGSHYLAPEDFATIYNLGPLYSAGFDGTGQSIVVVGQSALSLSDIRSFRARYGLPANDPKVGTYSVTDPGFTSSQLEGTLDVEWTGAVAPRATINYVYGANAFVAMFYAIQQNISPIISVSYGSCETDYSSLIFRAMAQQANAQGITILVSSGDSGAAACNLNSGGPLAPKGIAPQFPAALPEVTAVGGTQFVEGTGNYWAPVNSPAFGSALSYIPEAAWNESSLAFGLASTGGGASRIFPQPAWQTGSGAPDDGARHVPDISLTAAIHDSYLITYSGAITSVAGTSASAPAMAGIVALLNQYQVSKGFQRSPGLGNINPQLYRLAQSAPAVFHDIVAGDNIVPCVQGSPDCLTGSFGYAAAPGYDMATGLGSIDANALVTQWNSATQAVTVTLVADPGPRTLNDTIQLTAAVAPAARFSNSPTGTVTFSLTTSAGSGFPVGSVPLANGRATLPVPLYLAQSTGSITFVAQYSGDAAFSSGGATLRVTVTLPPMSGGAVVVPSQPVNVWPQAADAEGLSWSTTLTLRELVGVPALLTGFTIDGKDQKVSDYFPSPNIPGGGSLTAAIVLRDLPVPVTRVFGFTGIDSIGRTWARQVSVLFYPPPSYSYFTLTATPATVVQNKSADPACQWPVQLSVDEQSGSPVSLLTSLYTGNGVSNPGANLSSQIPSIFGTTRLDAYSSLQGTLCFANPKPGASTEIIVGLSNGSLQTATVTFAAAPATPAQLSASPNNLNLAAAAGKSTQSTLNVNLSDAAQSWSASVFPANRTTGWLKLSQIAGAGNGQITLTADGTGFGPGAYRAIVTIQSAAASPQVINVPVMFVHGGSTSGTQLSGGLLYGSTTTVGSPGTLFNIFGTNLAATTKSAPSTPLTYSLDGVSVTVNGIAAQVLSISPDMVTLQIPFEVGVGPSVIGIHNNGEIAGLSFTMAPSGPGIFAEVDGTVFGRPTPKRGGYLTLFVSGMGEVSPALFTGYAPTSSVVSSLPKPVLPLSVTVGGTPVFIQFAGIGRGSVGLGQVNVLLPDSTPAGSQPVVVTVGGKASPPVYVTVQ